MNLNLKERLYLKCLLDLPREEICEKLQGIVDKMVHLEQQIKGLETELKSYHQGSGKELETGPFPATYSQHLMDLPMDNLEMHLTEIMIRKATLESEYQKLLNGVQHARNQMSTPFQADVSLTTVSKRSEGGEVLVHYTGTDVRSRKKKIKKKKSGKKRVPSRTRPMRPSARILSKSVPTRYYQEVSYRRYSCSDSMDVQAEMPSQLRVIDSETHLVSNPGKQNSMPPKPKKRARCGTGEILSTLSGTPLGRAKSPYKTLPCSKSWALGISQVILADTQASTGTFDKIMNVVKKGKTFRTTVESDRSEDKAR